MEPEETEVTAVVDGGVAETAGGGGPLAPAGSTDYSYFSAVDVCLPAASWEDRDEDVGPSQNFITNGSTTSNLPLECVLPATYYNDVGYSSDEIYSITVYGYHENPDVDFETYFNSRGTTDTASATHGSCALSSTGSVITSCTVYPTVDWADPFIILEVVVPKAYYSGGAWRYSSFYSIRVYHVE